MHFLATLSGASATNAEASKFLPSRPKFYSTSAKYDSIKPTTSTTATELGGRFEHDHSDLQNNYLSMLTIKLCSLNKKLIVSVKRLTESVKKQIENDKKRRREIAAIIKATRKSF